MNFRRGYASKYLKGSVDSTTDALDQQQAPALPTADADTTAVPADAADDIKPAGVTEPAPAVPATSDAEEGPATAALGAADTSEAPTQADGAGADLKQAVDQSPFKLRKPADADVEAKIAGAKARSSPQVAVRPNRASGGGAPPALAAVGHAVLLPPPPPAASGSIVRELVSASGTGCAEALGLINSKSRGSLKVTWRTRWVNFWRCAFLCYVSTLPFLPGRPIIVRKLTSYCVVLRNAACAM